MAEGIDIKKVKRNCGLKDIYIAPVITNTASAYEVGEPVPFSRALSAKITYKYNSETLRSDDGVEDITENLESIDVELGVHTLTNKQYTLLYDCSYVNGYLLRSAEDKAKEVAIGFRTKRTDNTYDFYWYYVGKFTERPDESYETEAEKPKTQTATIKGTFYAREKANIVDGKVKHLTEISIDECELIEEYTEAREAIKNWFGEVQEYKEHKEVTAPTDFTAVVNGSTLTQVDCTFSATEGAKVVKLQYSTDGVAWADVDTTGSGSTISIPAPLTKDSTNVSISNLTTGTYSFKLVVDGLDSNIVSGVVIA